MSLAVKQWQTVGKMMENHGSTDAQSEIIQRKNKMKKIKQGQARWKVVVYGPGKIEGYDDQYVAAVYPCFITSEVQSTTMGL